MKDRAKMEQQSNISEHRKRKRRRREDRIPLRAKLSLDDNLTGHVGVVASDFFRDIFNGHSSQDDAEVRYIAATSSLAQAEQLISDARWTILPVRLQSLKEVEKCKLQDNSISFPASSSAFRSVFEAGSKQDATRNSLNEAVELWVLDTDPLKLESVYVDIDGDALIRHREVQKQFGGGFFTNQSHSPSNKAKGKARAILNKDLEENGGESLAQRQDGELVSIIRQSLASEPLVRRHDSLEIPLPTHPITHASFPRARITACEPVSQGLVSEETRIIITRSHRKSGSGREPAAQNISGDVSHEAEEDTSNEQFFSAIEDAGGHPNRASKLDSRESHEGSLRDSESSSDESSEDLISLSAPRITAQTSAIASARNASTPRASWTHKNGTSTPGSVFSSFTANTARRISTTRTVSFKARSLSYAIPDHLLHPRASIHDDDESRIFVDMKALLKLGCFSGDWVEIRTPTNSESSLSGAWDLSQDNDSRENIICRPARIFGLSDLNVQKHHAQASRKVNTRRRGSFAYSKSDRVSLTAWLCPILLYNLGKPSTIQVNALGKKDAQSRPSSMKLAASLSPPLAKEVTLLRVASPLSTERDLQMGLFSALKAHFEIKRRIQKSGDLVALVIDTKTSRLLISSSGENESDAERILGMTANPAGQARKLVWFKIGQVKSLESRSEEEDEYDVWGGAVSIDPSKTRMKQVGTEQCRVPPLADGSWDFHYGLRPVSMPASNGAPNLGYTLAPPRPFLSNISRRITELLAAATSPHSFRFGLEPMVMCLHSTQKRVGKLTMVTKAAMDLGIHSFEIDAYDIMTEGSAGGDVKSEALLKARFERALSCGAGLTAIILRHLEVLTADRMIATLKALTHEVRILIVTTTELEKVPEGLRGIFTHELEVSAPDESERHGILKDAVQIRGLRLAHDVDLSSIALKTAALVAGNLVDIVERASSARESRLESLVSRQDQPQRLIRDVLVSGGEDVHSVVMADFDIAVDAARQNFADAIGAPKIPNVTWDDVGGLENVKEAVIETIQLPLQRPELFAKGMKKRSGILFYGPPGTGKTLLAKAIATEFSLNFFSVKGPELLNMYIGESEANVRRVFQRARDARPCVVFFDELDSVAPKRGNQGDSGGVMDRIVSQLLAELDGMGDGEGGGSGGVFVIGATNRPDLLDQALLRPGRFDKMLYLGIPDTHEKQLTIIEALSRKFKLHPETSLRRVAWSLPFTYTGADLYALCSDAMLKAITRKTLAVEKKMEASATPGMSTAYFFDHLAKPEDIAITVTEDDFQAARQELVGSVSAKEMEHYRRVRQNFEGNAQTNLIQDQPLLKPPVQESNRLLPPPPQLPKPPPPPSSRIKPLSNDTRVQFDKTDKGKGKSKDKGKGKGKAKATSSDSDDDDDDDEDAYLTSNDFTDSPERKPNGGHYYIDGGVEDEEEELYG